ncbi:MAG: anaerobic glycerol-3-phosphate dehydrogenase subunit C [Phycisphaerae bacterium]|nr:anaerobic glycerol-3-phosphate dehydrogenase subunit C [Phycisphaerae bacterium]
MSTYSNKQIADDLRGGLSGRVYSDSLTRALYSTDASIYQIDPLCVVMPEHEADIAHVVRYAGEKGLPVIARGAGSGLAGETLGSAIILDMSRFMNRVVKVDEQAGRVVVQPGVVLEQLNRQLAPLGKQIGPDPASGSRATIGGMIGNNATGAHSMKYGYIGRHIQHLKAVSAGGERVDFGRSVRPDKGGIAGKWAADVHDLLSRKQALMAKVKPACDRNGSGYNVYAALNNGEVNLAEMIAGSEGTLAIVTEATLGLVDLPKVKMLLQVNFDSMGKMTRAIPAILEHQPSACELMDGTLLGLARAAYPNYHDVLPGGVAASLVVELDGNDVGDVEKRLKQLRLMVEGLPVEARPMGTKDIIRPADQAVVWTARKAGVPLLFRNKSARQPIPVIEDVAVDPRRMVEYIEGLEAITKEMEVPLALYAHIGHGELHPRPYFDLHKAEDVKKMRTLAERTFKLAWSLGGTISGEHGEGLVRVSFIKEQYGEEMYDVFRKVKGIFDPENRLNPGKIINDDPEVMTKNLRFAHKRERRDWPTNLIFRENEFTAEIEQCNGNGLCRTNDPTLSMCPIFRATGDEDASPRAKGNIMRHWYNGLLNADVMQTPEFKRIADLCVNCKMCASQCPSLVNIPKMMMEARAEYVKANGLTMPQYILTRSEFMSQLGSRFGAVANLFTQASGFRWFLEKVSGLDRRRAMPKFDRGSNLPKLRQYLKKQGPLAEPMDKVAYFVDMFATWNDHALGRTVVDVLHHNDVEVVIAKQKGMAMPAISYGDLPYARKAIEYNVSHLAELVRAGYKVICSEPTAALCLKEEYLDVVDTEDAQLVAENTWELTEYLAGLNKDGKLKKDFQPVNLKLAYHMPCHYEAMKIEEGTEALMKLIDGIELEMLPHSCCGIAGTFGFQKKNFDLSMKAGEPMLGPLRDSKSDYGLTECATCKMQMELGGQKVTLHPIKILAVAYGLLKLNELK